MAAPASEADLLARARSLSGRTLAELALRFDEPVPPDLRRAKGWVGRLVERALGADSGSRPRPDFAALGVELKTVPVDRAGRPRESTFVCTIPLALVADGEWQSSLVWAKLRRVLWIPVEADPVLAIAARRLGEPLLWSPSPAEEAILRFDWEELSGRIGRGDVEPSARLGHALQIRPKAADSRARTRAYDADGTPIATLPRGFYLRASFTAEILAAHYRLP